MKAISAFSGLGGLDIAAGWAGIETVLQVEIDPHCQAILRKHWPGVKKCKDVRDVTLEGVIEAMSARELEKDYDEAVRLYNKGFSIENIASLYGVTRQSMWKCLKRRGVQFRDNKRYGSENHFFRGGSRADDHAQNILEGAIERSEIIRPTICEQCGAEAIEGDSRTIVQAHHVDYNKPFDVMWLCRKCHFEWHKSNKAIEKEVMPTEAFANANHTGIDMVFGGFPNPVNHTVLRDAVRGLVTSVIYGQSFCESFARLGPDGLWEKTSQGYSQVRMDGFSGKSSVTWPRWGTMSDGVCGAPVTWKTTKKERLSRLNRQAAHLISGNASLLWPTPTTRDFKSPDMNPDTKRFMQKTELNTAVMWATPGAASCGMTAKTSDRPQEKSTHLETQVHLAGMWSTPIATEARQGLQARESGAKGTQQGLSTEVIVDMWSTPNAADCTRSHGGGNVRSLRTDTHGMGGVLNPDWVETLMGLPVGFTAGPPVEARRNSHGNPRA